MIKCLKSKSSFLKKDLIRKSLLSALLISSSVNLGILILTQNLFSNSYKTSKSQIDFSKNNSNYLQENKLHEIKTEYKEIETDIPINDSLVITDLEPFYVFHVTNYKYLSNVQVTIDLPDLVEIIDHKNGEFVVKGLRMGVGYLTINADEVKIPFKTKISIGPFKKSDILYYSENFIATTRGCFWYTYSYPDKKIIIKHVFNDIWPKPNNDDILFKTSNILVTKYGIFNTEKGIQILKNEFSKDIKSEYILQVTPYIIATIKGIFNNDGTKLLVHELPIEIIKSNIILMGGKIIVTNKGIFNSSNIEILADKFRVPGKLNLSNFFDISSTYSKTLIATSDGVYDSDGIQICTPDILSNYKVTTLTQWDFHKITYAYIHTSYGIYWFSGKFQPTPNKIIDEFDCGIITNDGIYGLKGEVFGKSLYPHEISIDDIILTNGSIVFTKKGIVDVGFVYECKMPLTYDSIYGVNSINSGYPGKTYVTYSGLYTSTNKKMNIVCDGINKPIQLLKNEVLAINDNNLITPYSLICFDHYDPRKSYEFDILKPEELYFPSKSPSQSSYIVPIDNTLFSISIWLGSIAIISILSLATLLIVTKWKSSKDKKRLENEINKNKKEANEKSV